MVCDLTRRFSIKRLNARGIPELDTISVSTTGTVIIFQLCPWRVKQLCNSGIMLLHIDQTPGAGAGSSAYTISLGINNVTIPLTNTRGENVTADDIVEGTRLLVYFNKAQRIFQTLS